MYGLDCFHQRGRGWKTSPGGKGRRGRGDRAPHKPSITRDRQLEPVLQKPWNYPETSRPKILILQQTTIMHLKVTNRMENLELQSKVRISCWEGREQKQTRYNPCSPVLGPDFLTPPPQTLLCQTSNHQLLEVRPR